MWSRKCFALFMTDKPLYCACIASRVKLKYSWIIFQLKTGKKGQHSKAGSDQQWKINHRSPGGYWYCVAVYWVLCWSGWCTCRWVHSFLLFLSCVWFFLTLCFVLRRRAHPAPRWNICLHPERAPWCVCGNRGLELSLPDCSLEVCSCSGMRWVCGCQFKTSLFPVGVKGYAGVQVMLWCSSLLPWRLWPLLFWLRSTRRRGSLTGSCAWCKGGQRPVRCSAIIQRWPKSLLPGVCQRVKRYDGRRSASLELFFKGDGQKRSSLFVLGDGNVCEGGEAGDPGAGGKIPPSHL